MSSPVSPVKAFEGARSWLAGMRYGFMGFPLAFVALPLYVLWPHHMAANYGVTLAALGALLLGMRLLDAVVDPAIGRWVDWRASHKNINKIGTWRLSAFISLLLFVGIWALFFPTSLVTGDTTGVLIWSGFALAVTYFAFSWLTVAHHSWGARLGGTDTQRGRVVAWREGFGLCGVLVASVLPTLAGLPALVTALGLALAAGVWLWSRAVVPEVSLVQIEGKAPSAWAPLALRPFRRLLAVYVVSGMASAIPATLVLFFIQDRLQAPESLQPAFLGGYFLCAALSIGLWLKAVGRWGLVRTWGLGMGLSVAVFGWVAFLGAGDWPWFLLVCALSGAALGADLVLPPAMLAGLIGEAGERGRSEGAFMGWWGFATKLNLALAAGLALPLLGWLGYAPGQQDPQALAALTVAYAVVPCVLKLGAAALLYVFFLKKESP